MTHEPDLKQALVLAVSFARQCDVACDVWRGHGVTKVAPADQFDRWRKNGLSLCYRVSREGTITRGRGMPDVEVLLGGS